MKQKYEFKTTRRGIKIYTEAFGIVFKDHRPNSYIGQIYYKPLFKNYVFEQTIFCSYIGKGLMKEIIKEMKLCQEQ